MKKNKSPGLDGFTVKFFKVFFVLILGNLFCDQLIMVIKMGL